ncbi:MAG TPA: Ig-like domain-containing protein [Candidatus Paceibacterota bacterium]
MKGFKVLLLGVLLTVAGCKQEQNVCVSCPSGPPAPPPPPQPPPPPPPPPSNYSLTVSPKSATCTVGENRQFGATVSVPAGQSAKVAWGSTSATTATVVDSTGKVNCVSPGVAKIWAKLATHQATSDTAVVTVNAPPPVPVSITLAPKDTSVFRTQSYVLRRTVTVPAGQSTASTCVSRNAQIATVDTAGTVMSVWPGTGNVAGVTWVVCTASADQSKKDSVLVRVPLSRVTNLSVVPDSVRIKVGQEMDLSVSITGDPGVSTNFICFSSSALYVTATATGTKCRVKGIFVNTPSYTPVTVRTIGLDANNQPVTKGTKVFVDP